MDKAKFNQLVWDYQLSPEQFFAILEGKTKTGVFDQNWAIGRVLENLNYYEALALVPRETLAKNWSVVKPKIFNKSIRDGYEYVLQRQALSPTG